MGNKKDDMEKTIQTIKGDNVELMKENQNLKSKISGFKRSNENYRKQVDELKANVERYKALDKESDELNEQRQKELAEKDKVIRGLQEQVNYLTQKYTKMTNTLDELRDENTRLNNDLKLAKMPWWKKVF